jgi:hypothetical protein
MVASPLMEKRGQATDRHGRTWVARVGSQDEAEEEDFRFWYEELTPEERVRAVEDCLLSSLKARGVNEIPRLRRVCRVVERKRR